MDSQVGVGLGIAGLPEDGDAFEEWGERFERERFKYRPANKRLTEQVAPRNLFQRGHAFPLRAFLFAVPLRRSSLAFAPSPVAVFFPSCSQRGVGSHS